jgi:hypothetical protein
MGLAAMRSGANCQPREKHGGSGSQDGLVTILVNIMAPKMQYETIDMSHHKMDWQQLFITSRHEECFAVL